MQRCGLSRPQLLLSQVLLRIYFDQLFLVAPQYLHSHLIVPLLLLLLHLSNQMTFNLNQIVMRARTSSILLQRTVTELRLRHIWILSSWSKNAASIRLRRSWRVQSQLIGWSLFQFFLTCLIHKQKDVLLQRSRMLQSLFMLNRVLLSFRRWLFCRNVRRFWHAKTVKVCSCFSYCTNEGLYVLVHHFFLTISLWLKYVLLILKGLSTRNSRLTLQQHLLFFLFCL